MKKQLSLLAAAVLCWLPTFADAGTDTYGYGNLSLTNFANGKSGDLSQSTTGATYKSEFINFESMWRAFYFKQGTTSIQVVTPAENCIIGEVSMTPRAANASNAPTLELYCANNADYTDETLVGTLNKDTKSVSVTGEYSYFRLKCTSSTTSSRLTDISFTWNKIVPKICEQPTVSAVAYVPGAVVTLTSPTEESTLTYTWGIDAEADVATATGTTVENATSPATIAIPTDAVVGNVLWIKATAKRDGYAESEEYSNTWKIESNVLAAPIIDPDGGEIERGDYVNIQMPQHATTLHYTVNDGEEQTSTDSWGCSLQINENTTLKAWATGDAPFTISPDVTKVYTVVTPTLDTPTIWPTENILPGSQLNISAPKGNLTYSWGIKNGEVVIENYEATTVASNSVDITVPEVEVDYTLWVNAVAKADGYNDSKPLEFTYTFPGIELDAPTFSLAGAEDLMSGTQTTIQMPVNATELHYTINGEAEQTATENVTLTIDKDMEVVAWATGAGLYTRSQDAKASYKLEVIDAYTDVLVPTMWVTGDFTTDLTESDRGSVKGPHSGNDYTFNGCFEIYNNDVNTFYFNSGTCALYNTTGKAKIEAIKLDTPVTSGYNTAYIRFADEPVTVGEGVNQLAFNSVTDFGVWRNVPEGKENSKYFCIWSYSGKISRVLVKYNQEDIETGVESVEYDSALSDVYDLAGRKVLSGADAAAVRDLDGGLYIINGKKVVVRK